MRDEEIPLAFSPPLPLMQQVHIILLAQTMLPLARHFTPQPVRVLEGRRFKLAYQVLEERASPLADPQDVDDGLVMVLTGRQTESAAALLRQLALLRELLHFCHGPLAPLLAPF